MLQQLKRREGEDACRSSSLHLDSDSLQCNTFITQGRDREKRTTEQ